MANIKTDKLIEKIRNKLEDKIDQDNREICKFFEDSFGNSSIEVPDKIKKTYLNDNPKITTDEGDELKGWDVIKPYLESIPSGTRCQVDNVDADIDYLPAKDPEDKVKNDFDFHAHVKTTFSFGGVEAGQGIDPDGEGDMRHRRTCEWEPGG